MRSRAFFAGLVALAAAAAGSCAQVPPASVSPAFPPCDTIASSATTTSRGTSLAYAQRSLAQLYPDARGDLLGVGYRRIRVISRQSTCAPFKVGGVATGLVTCTVRARVCGR